MSTADTIYTLATAYLITLIVLPIVVLIGGGIFLLWYLEKRRRMGLSGAVAPEVSQGSVELDELPEYSEAPQSTPSYSRPVVHGPVDYWD